MPLSHRSISNLTVLDRFTTTVSAHGSIVLGLTDTIASNAPTFTYYLAANSTSVLSGAATTRIVNDTATVVGFIGNDGANTLTLTGVDGGTGGSKLISVDYINADVTQSNTACSNCRNAWVSVNGGDAVQLQMPISGGVSHQFRSPLSH